MEITKYLNQALNILDEEIAENQLLLDIAEAKARKLKEERKNLLNARHELGINILELLVDSREE